jgi:hypothetical protein
MTTLSDDDREAVRVYLERLAALTRGERRQCLVCDAAVVRWSQVGRCVYALPCAHRQYQGKAPRAVTR